MNAIILCAGEGVRMRPVTEHLPKPLLPVIGRPLIDRTMDRLFACNITRIGVNTHHKADLLQQHLAPQGNNVLISHEPVLLGTGGALRFFEAFVSDPFVIHSGDIVTDFDIDGIVKYHEFHRPMITLALIKNEKTNYIRIDDKQDVVEIAAHPRPNASPYYTFSGISVFSNRVFSFLPERDVFSMVEIFNAVKQGGGVIKGCPCTMTWCNINSCVAYWDMHRAILHREISFPGIEISAMHFFDPSSTIRTSDIHGFVSIGARCEVGDGVSLKNTVVFDDTHLEGGSYTDCLVSDEFCVQVREPVRG